MTFLHVHLFSPSNQPSAKSSFVRPIEDRDYGPIPLTGNVFYLGDPFNPLRLQAINLKGRIVGTIDLSSTLSSSFGNVIKVGPGGYYIQVGQWAIDRRGTLLGPAPDPFVAIDSGGIKLCRLLHPYPTTWSLDIAVGTGPWQSVGSVDFRGPDGSYPDLALVLACGGPMGVAVVESFARAAPSFISVFRTSDGARVAGPWLLPQSKCAQVLVSSDASTIATGWTGQRLFNVDCSKGPGWSFLSAADLNVIGTIPQTVVAVSSNGSLAELTASTVSDHVVMDWRSRHVVWAAANWGEGIDFVPGTNELMQYQFPIPAHSCQGEPSACTPTDDRAAVTLIHPDGSSTSVPGRWRVPTDPALFQSGATAGLSI